MTNANTTKKTVTPADVVAKAAEENLVSVPAQAEGEKKVVEPTDVQKADDSGDDQSEPKLTLIEGGKRTLKNKLSGVVSKAAQHKKALLVTVGLVGAVTYAVVKNAKKAAAEVLDENTTELTEDETPVTDESAA